MTDRIHGPDWRAWQDPAIPEFLVPSERIVDCNLAERADHTAIIADGAKVSYRALHARIQRLAAGLSRAGVRPESRVLFFGTDSLEYVALWLATVQMGAIPAVVSDLYKARDLLYFITDTGCQTLFLDAEQAAKLGEIADKLPPSLHRVILREAAELRLPDREIILLADMESDEPAPHHPRHAQDVTYMFYSGGTTGAAKGITHLAHDFVLVPARQGAYWEYAKDDIVYATSRKYFTHGIWPGLLIPLAHGATLVLDRRPPTPDVVKANLSTHRVTKLISVPTVLRNLLDQESEGSAAARAERLPDLKLVISASEKISPELFDRFEARFGVEILDSIGSSEITYEWIANRPAESRRGSLGKPIFGYEIRLVDDDGADVTQPNIPGEAWVRSLTSCFFYWRKLEQTREALVGGWMRTGDYLVFDEDGFFWFHGRSNDLFKTKGLWVSPLEIEAAMAAHPAVREAAVTPAAGPDGLTEVKAWLVLRPGHVLDSKLQAELVAAVRPLGGYKAPKLWEVMEALPRTTLSKIDRRALRERQ